MIKPDYEDGHTTCYGTMHEYQNTNVVCDDEIDDYLHPDGFPSWEAAIIFFRDLEIRHDIKVVQLEAC